MRFDFKHLTVCVNEKHINPIVTDPPCSCSDASHTTQKMSDKTGQVGGGAEEGHVNKAGCLTGLSCQSEWTELNVTSVKHPEDSFVPVTS